jgi:hypothetical protein
VSVGENLRLGAGPAHERIVCRHAAVVANSQRLPDVVTEILCPHAQTVVVAAHAAQPVAVANGDVQRAVGSEQHSSCEVSGCFPRVGNKHLLNLTEFRAIETPASDRERAALRTSFGIRDVDEVVLRELRMDDDRVQTVCSGFGRCRCSRTRRWRRRRRHGRSFPHWLRIEYAVADDTQTSRAFGDQYVPVGQKGDAPRVNQPGRNRDDANLLLGIRFKYRNTRCTLSTRCTLCT